MRLLEHNCNLSTIEDGRGGIFTFIPEKAIVEFSFMITHPGKQRGFHWHPEFDEYVLFTSGTGIYTEWVNDAERAKRAAAKLSEYPYILMGPGSCIYFPSGCSHTLKAITEVRMVALLTKKWDDCKEALVRVKQ